MHKVKALNNGIWVKTDESKIQSACKVVNARLMHTPVLIFFIVRMPAMPVHMSVL